jgi:hypothetical protein
VHGLFPDPFSFHIQKGGGSSCVRRSHPRYQKIRDRGASVRFVPPKALAHTKCTPPYRTAHLSRQDGRRLT